MTILRTSSAVATLRALSTITGFIPGQPYRIAYPVELLPDDIAAGAALVSARLQVAASFGTGIVLIAKNITTSATAEGQITDNAATDGKGALYFLLTGTDTSALNLPAETSRVFAVTITDSLGRTTEFDAGAIFPNPAFIVNSAVPVASVTVAPTTVSGAVNDTFTLTVTARDAGGNVLTGRTATFTSNDVTIATVNSGGVVTIVADGETTIDVAVEGIHATVDVLPRLPLDPVQFAARINTMGPGQLDALYVRGVNQTLTPSAGSVGTQDCTLWDDCLHPGVGRHFRPKPGFASGARAEADGRVLTEGLYIPVADADTHSLNRGPVDDVQAHALNANSVRMIFSDRTKGFTWFFIGRGDSMRAIMLVDPLAVLPTFTAADASTAFWGDQTFDDHAVMKFQNNPFIAPLSDEATHSIVGGHLLQQVNYVDVPGYMTLLFHRDITWTLRLTTDMHYDQPGRQVELIKNEGINATRPADTDVVMKWTGRPNGAQRQFLHDWLDLRYPNTYWKDPRRLVYFFGDSFQAPADLRQIMSASTYNGAPRVPNLTMVNQAVPGNSTAIWQHPLIDFVRDQDFRNRPAPAGSIICLAGERINAQGALTETQNMAWADDLKAIDARIRVTLNTEAYGGGPRDDAAAQYYRDHAVQDGHAYALVDYEDTMPYDPDMYGDGLPSGQEIVWWVSSHPSVAGGVPPGPHQEFRVAIHRGGILACLEDQRTTTLPTRSEYVRPNVNLITLTAGAPTNTPTWTVYNHARGTLSKTLAFSSGNVAVCTVNASTGLITRVAAGRTWVKVVTDDGGVGIIVVVCT